MPPIRFSRAALLGIAVMLSAVLVAPTTGHAQDDPVDVPIAAAPALPSWDETSGYGAVEASRAAISSLVPSDVRWAPEPAIVPAPSAEAHRLAAAQQALLSADLGSLQEETLMAVVANASADRAELLAQFRAIELAWAPEAWTPARAIAPASSVAARRVIAAERALASDDLGSLQEEALLAVVAAATWDETSGYGSVEATRAAISSPNNPTIADEAAMLAQFRAIELAMSSSLETESDAVPTD